MSSRFGRPYFYFCKEAKQLLSNALKSFTLTQMLIFKLTNYFNKTLLGLPICEGFDLVVGMLGDGWGHKPCCQKAHSEVKTNKNE